MALTTLRTDSIGFTDKGMHMRMWKMRQQWQRRQLWQRALLPIGGGHWCLAAALIACLSGAPRDAAAWGAGATGATMVAPMPDGSGDVTTRRGWYRGVIGPTATPAEGSAASPSAAPDDKATANASASSGGAAAPEGASQTSPAPKQWDRALPFFAQRVIDRGYELPNPYDVGYSYFNGAQRYQLSNLMVGANGNGLRSADFVQFEQSRIRSESNQFQLGAWLFPFMNVYAIVGNVRGGGDININFSSLTALEQFFGLNIGCAGRRPPPNCANPIKLPTAHADYSGHTYGGGFTLVGTYGDLFFSLPVTYTVSDISMSDSLIHSWNISPRIGWNVHLGSAGILTPYVGATWFRTKAVITGHFDIPIEAAGGQTQRLDYQIDQSVTGSWSGVAGLSWAVSKRFGLLAEFGYGYNRNDVILTAFLRF
ncbi:hypothetical protein PCA31118_03239 [Pandoraea captiosa]|uniref:Uncharacterized protein n=1 Tax=Pandoraea captiosa TaxID=2508302 RepID=A0A5E5A7A1_9BURK|nr:autotransporter outer membrane beta-barrel domain-containing protein [Pandoraea captiosa]VVE69499.1 hypothetical protein PCA31118_03239 [Pandoraea captiosa]